jgi:hypothetical protein
MHACAVRSIFFFFQFSQMKTPTEMFVSIDLSSNYPRAHISKQNTHEFELENNWRLFHYADSFRKKNFCFPSLTCQIQARGPKRVTIIFCHFCQ